MQNPLDIPEILAIVASNFQDYEDLKRIRVLNKNWMKETLRKWRSTAIFLINNETFPILFRAFDESDLVGLSEEEREAAQSKKDPFLLKEVPFKKYRFTREQDWLYPLNEDELEKKLIWEKVISPNAVYLDVGECSLKEYCKYYLIGLKWILEHSKNVKELVMSPITSSVEVYTPPEVRQGDCNLPRQEWSRGPDPNCVRILMEGFSAPEVHSLKIYSPSSEYYVDGTRGPSPPESLFHDYAESVGVAKWFIGGMLPNLKKLELPWEGGATGIMQGLWRAAFPPSEDGYSAHAMLQSITATIPGTMRVMAPYYFKNYVSVMNSQLKELNLSVSELMGDKDIYTALYAVRNSLENLELHFYHHYSNPERCFLFENYFRPDKLILGNLTRFKVLLDYETFPENMIRFDWSYLWKLPKLQLFHFGVKNKIDKAWVRRKINLAEILSGSHRLDPNTVDSVKLTDLKSFHFHGNLETSAIRRLERIMKNLETLEVVLDEENFHVVKGSRGKFEQLKNLKLLPGSDVPESCISALKNSYPALRIEDESKKYSPALRKEIVVTLD